MATLAIFAFRGAAKTLVGEPPQTRHFGTSCPEVCCLRHRRLSLLFLIFALVRQSEQMINIRLDRHDFSHFLLGRPVLSIESLFPRRKLAALFLYIENHSLNEWFKRAYGDKQESLLH